MKPFNLEAAKAGAQLITRDGRTVRALCFDAKTEYPVIALVLDADGYGEQLMEFTEGGEFPATPAATNLDLFMAPVQRTAWVNLYKQSGVSRCFIGATTTYVSRTEAVAYAEPSTDEKTYLGAFSITYEE